MVDTPLISRVPGKHRCFIVFFVPVFEHVHVAETNILCATTFRNEVRWSFIFILTKSTQFIFVGVDFHDAQMALQGAVPSDIGY
jgi:hypothetical protein